MHDAAPCGICPECRGRRDHYSRCRGGRSSGPGYDRYHGTGRDRAAGNRCAGSARRGYGHGAPAHGLPVAGCRRHGSGDADDRVGGNLGASGLQKTPRRAERGGYAPDYEYFRRQLSGAQQRFVSQGAGTRSRGYYRLRSLPAARAGHAAEGGLRGRRLDQGDSIYRPVRCLCRRNRAG